MPLILSAIALFTAMPQANPLCKPVFLRTEWQVNPLGIDRAKPLLSWQLKAIDPKAAELVQQRYQIAAATSPALLSSGKPDLWNSGSVESQQQAGIEYSGKPLKSGQRVYWRVRSWTGSSSSSARPQAGPWSASAKFEVGILKTGDWKAQWITDALPEPATKDAWFGDRPAPLLRKEIELPAAPVRAWAHVSGLGYSEFSINGKRVGDHVLDPGWTDTSKRVLYSTYDVTKLLTKGKNALGAMLGGGWYDPLPLALFGRFDPRKELNTGRCRFLLQLTVEFVGGKQQTYVTDPTWRWAPGPILRNSIYIGERYDARREIADWDRAGFDDREWKACEVSKEKVGPLRSQSAPPIRVTRELKPVAVTEPKAGVFIVDMGQNFAGWARLKVNGSAGDRVKLRFGELLNPDGSLNVMTSVTGQLKNRRLPPGSLEPPTAWQEDEYILKGGADETWQPRFTFHGFRYVELTGFPGKPTLDTLTGLRLNSDVRRTGTFECSNPLLNRILEMCDWTFLSNLFSVQSDCPHREKLGYGGDIVASADAFMYQYDMATLYQKAVEDLADAQRSNGGFTETAPFIGIADEGLGEGAGPVGWGTAHPLLVELLSQRYDNTRIEQEQFPHIKRWIDLLNSKAKDGILDNGISDHESIAPKPRAVTGTTFYAMNLRNAMFASVSAEQDALTQAYKDRWHEVLKRFASEFIRADSVVGSGTQTSQAAALLHFNPTPRLREAMLKGLVSDIEKQGGHLTTGIFGTKWLFEALSSNGRADVAYGVATKKDFPSWGFMLENSATTLWEHWAKEERIYSHNHPMFGSIVEWMYRWLAGIQLTGAGTMDIRPQVVGDLTYVKASHETMQGTVKVEWRRTGTQVDLTVAVPANCLAQVTPPGKPTGRYAGQKTVPVGSGVWRFTSTLP